jgi:hypothetical protein
MVCVMEEKHTNNRDLKRPQILNKQDPVHSVILFFFVYLFLGVASCCVFVIRTLL